MDVKLKIIFTLLLLWIIFHSMAMPDTKFAKWGERNAGNYFKFLYIIAMIFLLPIIIICIVWLWQV